MNIKEEKGTSIFELLKEYMSHDNPDLGLDLDSYVVKFIIKHAEVCDTCKDFINCHEDIEELLDALYQYGIDWFLCGTGLFLWEQEWRTIDKDAVSKMMNTIKHHNLDLYGEIGAYIIHDYFKRFNLI
jgi:hypothetical protein